MSFASSFTTELALCVGDVCQIAYVPDRFVIEVARAAFAVVTDDEDVFPGPHVPVLG
jgi:hypothetical protein